jgi:hypothetical protein
MPNFPSIYLELQELWKYVRGYKNILDLLQQAVEDIQTNGAPPSGPAGGVLTGSYPNPNGLATLTGSLSGTLPIYFKTHTKFINGTNTQSDGGVIQFERQNPQENEDLFRVVIKGFDVTSSSDVLSGAIAGGVTVHGGNGNNFAPGGAATLYGGYGKPVGGAAIVQAGYGADSGGSVYITSGQGISNLGGDILIVASSGSVGSGGILLKTEDSAIAGDISIQTGDNVAGGGGTINLISPDVVIEGDIGTSFVVKGPHLSFYNSGEGIIFSGSNAPLNYYKTGSWTPVTSSLLTGISSTEGNYSIVGNVCHFSAKLNTSTTISCTAGAYMTGLSQACLAWGTGVVTISDDDAGPSTTFLNGNTYYTSVLGLPTDLSIRLPTFSTSNTVYINGFYFIDLYYINNTHVTSIPYE